jgi:prophage antirepressor-like protein
MIPLAVDDRRVRIVMIKGDPWWVLADVARVLGYRDAEQAKRLVRAKHLHTCFSGTSAGVREVLIIVSARSYQSMAWATLSSRPPGVGGR